MLPLPHRATPIERRTRGRHDLSSLVIAFAVCTMLLSFIDSIYGVVGLAEAMQVGLSPRLARGGIAMSMVPMSINGGLSALQLMLWPVGRRRVARAQRG